MTGGANEKAFFERLLRRVLRAHWVVGTEAAEFDRITEVQGRSYGRFRQDLLASPRIRRTSVEQNAVSGFPSVDALADCRRRIAALQRNLRDQQVRQRVKHYVRSPNELGIRIRVLLLPHLETFGQFDFPIRRTLPPRANRFGLEGDEYPFAAVLYCWNPSDLIRQGGAIYANRQFSIYVIGGWLESCESDQRNDLA